MRARSFSHVGITVRDFNTVVRFDWDVFGYPLVGVSDTPPERVKAFVGVKSTARLSGRRGATRSSSPASARGT